MVHLLVILYQERKTYSVSLAITAAEGLQESKILEEMFKAPCIQNLVKDQVKWFFGIILWCLQPSPSQEGSRVSPRTSTSILTNPWKVFALSIKCCFSNHLTLLKYNDWFWKIQNLGYICNSNLVRRQELVIQQPWSLFPFRNNTARNSFVSSIFCRLASMTRFLALLATGYGMFLYRNRY